MQCRMDILSWTILCNSLLYMSHNKILTYTWPLPKMQLQFRAPYCYILSNPIWFATTIMSTQSLWQFSSPLYHVIYKTHHGGGAKTCMDTINYKFFQNTCLLAFPLCFLPYLCPTAWPQTSADPHAHTSRVVHNCLYYAGNHGMSFLNLGYTDLGLAEHSFINYMIKYFLSNLLNRALMVKTWR